MLNYNLILRCIFKNSEESYFQRFFCCFFYFLTLIIIMSKFIVYLLFLILHVNVYLTTVTDHQHHHYHRLIHHCSVEKYTETFYRPKCSTKPLTIVSTRCRGQCASEDYLIYDWKAESLYRHQHTVACCSPNQTQFHEEHFQCDNHKQIETIQYHSISQCECRSCSDRCRRERTTKF